MASPRAARAAWVLLVVVAGALAARALFFWLNALVDGGPVIYGEGAVVHAGQILARGGDPYAPAPAGSFVGANYGPLSYAVVALLLPLGPFTGLRLVSVVATLAVSLAVARRARGRLAAVALALAFLALVPVETWGPVDRADPLAVALTAAAVLLAARPWPRAGAAGTAAVLAVLAKPTALLPLGIVLAYLLARERDTGARVLLASVVAGTAAAAVVLVRLGVAGMYEHLVRWNALALDASQLVGLVLVGAVAVGAFAVLGVATPEPRLRAYLAGALAVVLLGAREGSTINYLLDLGVAGSLAVATVARTDRAAVPALLAAQLVLAAVVLRPLDPSAVTGAWGDPGRVVRAADLARTSPHLVEDSGVLVANGIEPVVDDLFLWSRLVAAGIVRDDVTPRVRQGEFATIVSEFPLDALDQAPGYERQRWSAELVRAVLGSYRLAVGVDHHYRYVPRAGLVEAR